MSITSLSNNSCTIVVPHVIKDVLNSVKRTWAILYEDIPCRIRYLKGYELVQSGKEQAIYTHRIYIPQDIYITENMAIIDKCTGNSYDIGTVNPFYRTHIQVDAQRVTSIIDFTPADKLFFVARNGIPVVRDGVLVIYTCPIIPFPVIPSYPPSGEYVLDGGSS